MRPKYLNLTQIRLPLPGVVSILHRISGLLLFLSLPFVLCLFSGTLTSGEAFESYRHFVAHPLVKIILLVLLWAILHHLMAGVRFLFLDVHRGTDLPSARLTAKLVMLLSLVLTGVVGAYLW